MKNTTVKDNQIEITPGEAEFLFLYCVAFDKGCMVPDDSPLHKKSIALFQGARVHHMQQVCYMVFKTLAMQGRKLTIECVNCRTQFYKNTTDESGLCGFCMVPDNV